MAKLPKKRLRKSDFGAAENRFASDIQLVITRALKESGMTRAQFARALQVSEARVSQILSDAGKNMQARTIARIAHVLGLCPQLSFSKIYVTNRRRRKQNLQNPYR